MNELLEKFGLEALAKQERPLVGSDFVWEPGAKELRVVHEELFFEETPLALIRQFHLQHAERPHTSLTVRLALCWNGFRDALARLDRYSQSFQRLIPTTGAVNSAEGYKVGDLGLAWSWSSQGEPDVLAFARNNVFASLEGHDAAADLVPLARRLDDALRRLPTVSAYGDAPAGPLAEARRRAGGTPQVPVGGRLDLGDVSGAEGATPFFLSTSGSVNRATSPGGGWYYRAGAQCGPQEIILFRVGKGILPIRERLIVDVV